MSKFLLKVNQTIRLTKTKYTKLTGSKTFQPSPINWSYRYLGTLPRTKIKIKTTKKTFKHNQPHVGNHSKTPVIEFQPPKKKIEIKQDIINILEYSAKKNKAKVIAEYSTLYPETNSDSASGKSKGTLLVSARAATKNIRKAGNNGTIYHISSCSFITVVKFKDPIHKTTIIKIKLIETSYETICAADRKPPNNAYLELLDQPDIIIQ